MQLVESTMVRQQIAALSLELRRKYDDEIMAYLEAVKTWERGRGVFPCAPRCLAAMGKFSLTRSEGRSHDASTRKQSAPVGSQQSVDEQDGISLYGTPLD